MDKNINIELAVSSDKLWLKDTPKFKVGVKINNQSSRKLNFDISQTELWVNGEKNAAWDLAVQNGTLINLQIPANSDKHVQWPLGNALFRTTGNYALELHWRGFTDVCQVLVFD